MAREPPARPPHGAILKNPAQRHYPPQPEVGTRAHQRQKNNYEKPATELVTVYQILEWGRTIRRDYNNDALRKQGL